MIRYIKQNIKYTKGPVRLINGSTINEIFLVTGGKVTLYDDKMKNINYYTNNEIFGMR